MNAPCVGLGMLSAEVQDCTVRGLESQIGFKG